MSKSMTLRTLVLGNAYLLVGVSISTFPARAGAFPPQDPQMQEQMAELKQASALNKQALTEYTWQEQQTISIKGDVKNSNSSWCGSGRTASRKRQRLTPKSNHRAGASTA